MQTGPRYTMRIPASLLLRFPTMLASPDRDLPARGAAQDEVQHGTALRVLRQFRIVFNAVKTHFRQVERTSGIGGAQLWALSEISAAPGIGVTDLARALDIHQSTASNLIKALMKRKLIGIQRSTNDRRAVVLHPLPAGQAMLAEAPLPFAGVLPDALRALDIAALARLEADLACLICQLHADETAANIPLADL
jgi:DNA-binding MarR family transcriptional regulator